MYIEPDGEHREVDQALHLLRYKVTQHPHDDAPSISVSASGPCRCADLVGTICADTRDQLRFGKGCSTLAFVDVHENLRYKISNQVSIQPMCYHLGGVLSDWVSVHTYHGSVA